MAAPVDLIVRGGRVLDPRSGCDTVADIAIAGGVIVEIAPHIPIPAEREVDATGLLVLPGLVDLHVHLAREAGGHRGHAMLARAGVTTALDLTGPAEETLALAATHGAGLSVATLEAVEPDRHFPSRPSRDQIRDGLAEVLAAGAIGIKLHVDSGWAPDAAAAIITEAAAAGVWIAVHCGTTATASDLDGLTETIGLAGDAAVQIAHVNSYCRGDLDDPLEEARRAIGLLRAAPQHLSESYLDRHNSTTGECVGERPTSHRLVRWLERAGYAGTRSGLRDAIIAGWAAVVSDEPSGAALVRGEAALAFFDERNGEVLLGLPVNPASSRVLLASSKAADGRFDIDALATDGGGIPRNTTIAAGLELVELGLLTLSDLVLKSSTIPASLLGLVSKGRLAAGFDADLTVVDPVSRRVRGTVADGSVVFDGATVTGSASRVLATGRASIDTPVRRFDPAESALYRESVREEARRRA